MIGQQYGRLLVTDMTRLGRHLACVCQCECGNIKTIRRSSLTANFTKSCGCLRSERIIKMEE